MYGSASFSVVYMFDFLCSRELEPAVELPSHLPKELGDPTAIRP
jgi:hypothetical protein